MSRKFVTDAELAEMTARAVEAKLARGWNPIHEAVASAQLAGIAAVWWCECGVWLRTSIYSPCLVCGKQAFPPAIQNDAAAVEDTLENLPSIDTQPFRTARKNLLNPEAVSSARLARLVGEVTETLIAGGWTPPAIQDEPETYGSNSIAAQVKRDQEDGDLDGTEAVATRKPGSES